jgi:hypothetical protein
MPARSLSGCSTVRNAYGISERREARRQEAEADAEREPDVTIRKEEEE